MKLHADGTLEGTPEEIAQYQKMQSEQALKNIVDWSKQWGNKPPHYFYYPQVTCGSSAKELVDVISSGLAQKMKYSGTGCL